MTVKVETYYDFRSPYAYFADHRVRKADFSLATKVEWVGCPIFIDVILNLQVGNDPWAPYVDTLIPPKRAYLMADIRRMANFMGHLTDHLGSGPTDQIRCPPCASHPSL